MSKWGESVFLLKGMKMTGYRKNTGLALLALALGLVAFPVSY